MGLTLLEAARYEKRVERLAVLKAFAEGELLRQVPFGNPVGGSLSFPVEINLPRVGFRTVNEGYRKSYGVIHNDSEFVHLFGSDLDVDRSIVCRRWPSPVAVARHRTSHPASAPFSLQTDGRAHQHERVPGKDARSGGV